MKRILLALAGIAIFGGIFAADTTISYPTDSLPDGGYVVASGDTLIIEVASGNTYTYAGIISGDGAVKKTGAGTLVLAGDNTFSGGFDLNAGKVQADSETAFGAGTVTASTTSTSSQILFNVADGIFANNFDCSGSGTGGDSATFFLFNQNTTLDGSVRFYRETYIANANNSSIVVNFNGSVTSQNSGGNNANLVYKCYGDTHFKQKLTVSQFYIGNASSASGKIHLWSSENVIGELMIRKGSIVCEAENVTGGAYLNMRNNDGTGSIDLNGKSQAIKYISFGTGTGTSAPRDPGENDTNNLIKSENPATLTINRTWSSESASYSYTSRFAVNGNVSLVVNGHQNLTQVFTNRASTTTGDLTITKGTMKISGTASFRNAGTVTVGASGMLSVESSASESLRNVSKFVMLGRASTHASRCVFKCGDGVTCPFASRTLELELNDGATFNIGAGNTLRVKKLTVNGRQIQGDFDPEAYPNISVTGNIVAPKGFVLLYR